MLSYKGIQVGNLNLNKWSYFNLLGVFIITLFFSNLITQKQVGINIEKLFLWGS
jgi:hypothetical protein